MMFVNEMFNETWWKEKYTFTFRKKAHFNKHTFFNKCCNGSFGSTAIGSTAISSTAIGSTAIGSTAISSISFLFLYQYLKYITCKCLFYRIMCHSWFWMKGPEKSCIFTGIYVYFNFLFLLRKIFCTSNYITEFSISVSM